MKKIYILSIPIFLIVFLIILAGINKVAVKNKTVKSSKLQVVTSFYPMYFFASQIGGDKAEVTNITPAGAEPHDYEPPAQDIAHIEDSDLLIINGGKFEVWGDKIRENIRGKNVKLIIAGNNLTNQDPHIWLNPIFTKQMVKNILNGFIEVDSNNKLFYLANEQKLQNKLDELNNQYKLVLSSCLQKNIVTSHAAFGHLAKAYGLNQVSISGLSPDQEPSSKYLAGVANYVKEQNIKYIFFESLVSPKLSETIAREVGAKTMVLDPIEGISKEAMNKGVNYFILMKANLNNLKKALECK